MFDCLTRGDSTSGFSCFLSLCVCLFWPLWIDSHQVECFLNVEPGIKMIGSSIPHVHTQITIYEVYDACTVLVVQYIKVRALFQRQANMN